MGKNCGFLIKTSQVFKTCEVSLFYLLFSGAKRLMFQKDHSRNLTLPSKISLSLRSFEMTLLFSVENEG
jgi:hypothetical protein